MYEFEIKSKDLGVEDIPEPVLKSFQNNHRFSRSLLAWGEHCTECAIPHCYKTCDLYEARSDRKCRRFEDGMVKIPAPQTAYGYIVRITFKAWGALWTPANSRVFRNANAFENMWNGLARGARIFPGALGLGYWNIPRMFSSLTKGTVHLARALSLGKKAEYYAIHLYNPESVPVSYTLKMTPKGAGSHMPFQKRFYADPGHHEILVHIDEIQKVMDLSRPFTINLVPNAGDQRVTAYFSLMDFIRYEDSSPNPLSRKKIKCLIWDLDNVMWDGVLVESDPAELKLKEGIREILKELDERGILLSISSKNDEALAMKVLKRFGIDHYFLYPQINWQPKSLAMRTIQKELNVGMNTLAFMDDSAFERAEVSETLPDVLTLDSINYESLLHYPCFQGAKTGESHKRKSFYKAEESRKTEFRQEYGGDYYSFLKSCKMVVDVARPAEDNLNRIHDLIQRTNQMNFSPKRYSRAEVGQMLADEKSEKYVLSAADRFGEYGIIGFAVVKIQDAHMTDLLFSCRIQMKRVEHAFLAFILERYKLRGVPEFKITFAETDHNKQSAQVFADLGFKSQSAEGPGGIFVYDLRGDLPREDAVTIVDKT